MTGEPLNCESVTGLPSWSGWVKSSMRSPGLGCGMRAPSVVSKQGYRAELSDEERELRFVLARFALTGIVEDRAAAERWRDVMLMIDGRSEVGERLAVVLHRACEPVEAFEPRELFRVAD